MEKRSFNNIILTGRGGSGKSEFIDFLKKIDKEERMAKYHIGDFDEMDDFPWLYSMFKDEDIWERLGRERTLSKKVEQIYITKDYDIYDLMTLKFNLEVGKKLSANPGFFDKHTLFIEFARGRPDGYKRTFELFSEELLKGSCIFFLDNTFEESMRRNTVRSKASDSKQTILHHKVPVEVMEYYYKENDWKELTGGRPFGRLEMKGLNVPFVTVWNIPESHDFKVLEERYSPPLMKLWELYTTKE
jgi:hypothetical protein